ncbi:hypothetical protein [Actinoplanes sp. ATCC 53533]|nr:hypothetical protein [Actinoplanes sp. ATCC 53533]
MTDEKTTPAPPAPPPPAQPAGAPRPLIVLGAEDAEACADGTCG